MFAKILKRKFLRENNATFVWRLKLSSQGAFSRSFQCPHINKILGVTKYSRVWCQIRDKQKFNNSESNLVFIKILMTKFKSSLIIALA